MNDAMKPSIRPAPPRTRAAWANLSAGPHAALAFVLAVAAAVLAFAGPQSAPGWTLLTVSLALLAIAASAAILEAERRRRSAARRDDQIADLGRRLAQTEAGEQEDATYPHIPEEER